MSGRRHFRRVYDLAERVYPEGRAATRREEEDAWLLRGLSGHGVASEAHLVGYVTASGLKAADRRRVLERACKAGRVVEVEVAGRDGRWFARPEDLEGIAVYLASDASRFHTGDSIRVDGGYSIF